MGCQSHADSGCTHTRYCTRCQLAWHLGAVIYAHGHPYVATGAHVLHVLSVSVQMDGIPPTRARIVGLDKAMGSDSMRSSTCWQLVTSQVPPPPLHQPGASERTVAGLGMTTFRLGNVSPTHSKRSCNLALPQQHGATYANGGIHVKYASEVADAYRPPSVSDTTSSDPATDTASVHRGTCCLSCGLLPGLALVHVGRAE